MVKHPIISYIKWLNSTKFQICVLAMGLIYSATIFFKLDSAIMSKHIETLAIAYFGARMFEPIVERITEWLSNRKKNAQENT